jgi:hypothetical protein
MGRNGYRRDYRSDRGGYADSNSNSSAENSMSKGVYNSKPGRINEDTVAPQSTIVDLEKRLDNVKHDFAQQLEKIGGKETEKFDLIFAILTELQSRQAQLEESVRTLKKELCGPQQAGANANGSNMPPQLQGQFNGNMGNNGQFSNSGGNQQGFVQAGGQMSPSMGNQQPMQFAGVMQPDGSQAMFTAVPQMMVVSSPTNAGMQFAAMPQMMSPTGQMQPMSPQMAVQFVGQGPYPGGEAANGAGANPNMKLLDDTKGVQPMQPELIGGKAEGGAEDGSSQPLAAEE